jgi:hypothetical protein
MVLPSPLMLLEHVFTTHRYPHRHSEQRERESVINEIWESGLQKIREGEKK